MRRALHEEQTPRRLHEKATTSSQPQLSQRACKKPCAKMPHFKNARSSCST